MPLTPYYGDVGLSFLLGGVTTGSAGPSSLYIALFTADPTTYPDPELVASGYAREAITFTTPLNARVVNSAQITFGPPSVDWGNVTHWGVFNALTNGTLLFYDAFAEPTDLVNGEPVEIGAGTLIINLE